MIVFPSAAGGNYCSGITWSLEVITISFKIGSSYYFCVEIHAQSIYNL